MKLPVLSGKAVCRTLEFTIEAADVVGATQVFSSDFAFGTYPLAVIQ